MKQLYLSSMMLCILLHSFAASSKLPKIWVAESEDIDPHDFNAQYVLNKAFTDLCTFSAFDQSIKAQLSFRRMQYQNKSCSDWKKSNFSFKFQHKVALKVSRFLLLAAFFRSCLELSACDNSEKRQCMAQNSLGLTQFFSIIMSLPSVNLVKVKQSNSQAIGMVNAVVQSTCLILLTVHIHTVLKTKALAIHIQEKVQCRKKHSRILLQRLYICILFC